MRRLLLALIGAAILVAGLGGGWLLHYATSPLPIGPQPAQFSLEKGNSLTAAAHRMARAGVLTHPEVFILMGRALGEAGNVKAGNYEFGPGLTPYGLLRKITRGDYTLAAITLVEGWSFRQIRAALDEHPALRRDPAAAGEDQIRQRLEIVEPSLEGWFFPETYHFSPGTSDLAILRRAHRLMRSHLAAQWERRSPGLPLATPYEALILASVVEKETGRPEDRPLVAAVFVNRLRLGMRLQADPTVIYGLGDAFTGRLRRRDLVADTPYNTYTRVGLPPTPIATPGLASLAAALNPAQSDVLYFVSRGDGTSHFSRTLAEHERAVTRYQRTGQR